MNDPMCTGRRGRRGLRASTLVETLVAMLVAGIVLLAAAEALTLFTRLEVRQTRALLRSAELRAGYDRLAALLLGADSIREADGGAEVFRRGVRSELRLRDSVLIFCRGKFCDTLLGGVARLRIAGSGAEADSVEIAFGGGFTTAFPVRRAERERYMERIEEIEREYGYEEDEIR